MAYLAPYYVHSKFSNFEENTGSRTKSLQYISLLLSDLKREITKYINALEHQELSFYNKIDIYGKPDECYESFINILQNSKKNAKTEKESIRRIIINTINTLSQKDQNDLFNQLIVDVSNSKYDLDSLTPNQIKKIYINILSSILYNKLKGYKTQYPNLLNIIKDILNSKYTFTKAELTNIKNVRGAYGELVGGEDLADIIRNYAKDNIIDMIQTGQIKTNRLNREGQSLGSDYVIQFIDNDTQRLNQVGLQIKEYNLYSSSYSNVIKLSGFNSENWPGTKDLFTKNNLMNVNQWNALTYALINRIWFTNVGSYDIGEDGKRAMKKITGSSNPTELLQKVDSILRLLTVTNITEGLVDTVSGYNSGGVVKLSKIDSSTTSVNINIPAVFWAISSTYFFPTRWILQGLLSSLEEDSNALFVSNRYNTLKLKKNAQLPYNDAWPFWKAKGEAVNWNFIHGSYTSSRLLSVGNTQGEAIANSIKVSQSINIYRKRLEQIINTKIGNLIRLEI